MIILFLLGALGIGRLIVNSLHLAWHRYEEWALALVFGYFFTAWILLLTCTILGFKFGTIITFTLILAAWVLPQTRRSSVRLSFATARQASVWFMTTSTFSLIISCALYREMLGPGTDGAYSAAECLADLPLHTSIISNVAYSNHFTWHFSQMAQTYLTYHFLIDFLSGMITRWSDSIRLGLLLISIPLCCALIQLFFFLGYRTFKNVRAAALFVTIFFLSGSSFGFVQAIVDYFHSRSSLYSFLMNLHGDYSTESFTNFGSFFDMILSQRSFQLGLSIFCSIMILILQLNGDAVVVRHRILFLMGVLTGLLPLTHIHSFLMSCAVSIIFIWFSRTTIDIKEWFPAIMICLVLAVPQLIYQEFANHHASFVRFNPAWMIGGDIFPTIPRYIGLTLYILANFGIVLFLLVLSYRQLKVYGLTRLFALLGVAIFIIIFLVTFQPGYYDNYKFAMYSLLLFDLPVAQYLSQLSRARKRQWIPMAVILIFTGTLSVVWQMGQHQLLYSNKDFTEAREYRRLLPRDALVLSSFNGNNPTWSLAGQPVVAGKLDYIWDYGLPVSQMRDDVSMMYAGGDKALFLLQKYKVQYVVVGPYDRDRFFGINEAFFASHFPLIFHKGGVTIYQIRRIG